MKKITRYYGDGVSLPRIGKFLTDKAERIWLMGGTTGTDYPLWWAGNKPVDLTRWFVREWEKDQEKKGR